MIVDAKHYIDLMMAECESIIEGEYGDETQGRIDAFMDEMIGFKFPLLRTQSSDLPTENRHSLVVAARNAALASGEAAERGADTEGVSA